MWCLEQTCDPGLLDLHGAQAAEVLRLLQVIGIVACLGSLLSCLPLLSLLSIHTQCQTTIAMTWGIPLLSWTC